MYSLVTTLRRPGEYSRAKNQITYKHFEQALQAAIGESETGHSNCIQEKYTVLSDGLKDQFKDGSTSTKHRSA